MRKIMMPLFSPEDSAGSGQGLKELDKAIAVLGQLNVLIPVGYALGKSIFTLVKSAVDRGDVPEATREQALAAVQGFETLATEVRTTAEQWLEENPRIEG